METLGQKAFRSGLLQERCRQAMQILECCELCPRRCRVNRMAEELGFCATGSRALVASYGSHFGEESPLVGQYGSGTIFLASCSLRCCFCQNYDISHETISSQEVSPGVFAAIMLELQNQGCHNINFVTPSHVVPQILEALLIAFGKGLNIPLVYNSSGYENRETLDLLGGIIDIYMPDFKFWNRKTAEKYCDAADYPSVARQALKSMHAQVGDLVLDKNGTASRGLLVRHLLMPGGQNETKQILKYIAAELSENTYVNVMDQYRPCGGSRDHQELDRTISVEEYQNALEQAEKAGLKRLDKRDLSSLLKKLGII